MPPSDSRQLRLSVERDSLASWLADSVRSSAEELLDGELPGSRMSGSTLRLPALVELVKVDLGRKWRSGHPVYLESYLEALPELGTRDTIPAELILAEYEERRRSGATADQAEYADRFPCQAEMFRQLIARSLAATPGSLPGDLVDPAAPSRHLPASVGLPTIAPVRLPRKFGRYRIIRKLGQGAMGTVYLAQDTQLGRRVALKVPNIASSGDAGDAGRHDLDRFYREVRNAAILNHPNICPVHDQGEIGGVYYLTMAYIKGRQLSTLIDPEQPLSERWVANAVRKLALALSVAHARGVIHRDLKPSNIMVTARRELVIMDFGLAWRVGTEDARLTKSGMILGTPAYMSPEQLSGDRAAISPSCDIYSLGVIFYELLTGRRPFEGPTTAVLAQILYKDPLPPSAHRPDLDAQLESICLRAIAKKSQDRYAIMDELAAALLQYLRRQPASTQLFSQTGTTLDTLEPDAPDGSTELTDGSAEPVDSGPIDDQLPADAPPESLEDEDPHEGQEEDQVATPHAPRHRLAWLLRLRGAHSGRLAEIGSARGTPAGRAEDQSEDAELKSQWRAWTAIVELFALRRTRRRVDPNDYELLHNQLIRTCRSRAEASDATSRPLYESLETLARPWLTLGSLVRLDREILFDLLIRCRQAELRLHGLPQADHDLKDQIRALHESANRPMNFATEILSSLGMCLALILILALVILAIWQPSWLYPLTWH
jgi:serine/threonine protein kinase